MLHFARHLATSLTFNSRFSWFSKASQLVAMAGGTTLSFADVLGDFVVLQQEPAKALGAVYIYICYILYLRDNCVYP